MAIVKHQELADDGVTPNRRAGRVEVGGVIDGVWTDMPVWLGDARLDRQLTTTPDADGIWSLDLPANNDPRMTPQGSVYRYTRDRQAVYFFVPNVPGPLWLRDLLTVDPPQPDMPVTVVDSIGATVDPDDPGVLLLTIPTWRMTDDGTAVLIGVS